MSLKKKDKKVQILIIGKNSFIAKKYLEYSKFKKQITSISHKEIKDIDYKKFTHLINFSYDLKIKTHKYNNTNLIDKKICKLIDNKNLIYIYPSSRAVLKINKSREHYGKNKLIIEKLIKQYRKRKYLILRISNALDFNLDGQNLFISQLLNTLKKHKHITLDLHKDTYKDFIPLYFFSKCLDSLIEINKTGTFNTSSGIKTSIDEIANAIVKGYGKGKIIYLDKLYRDSFVLNNSKLKKTVNLSISKKEILDYCYLIGKKLKKYA